MKELETFTLAKGFRAAAVACGLKTSGVMAASVLDLALVAAEGPCSAAGVFTTNRVKAAPVLYDQAVLGANAANVRAIIANAGNANACTGAQGMADTEQMAALTAYALRCQPDQVLVLSTGVIGRQMDMAKVTQGIAEVTSAVAQKGAGFAAQAIMTTDTRPKVSSRQFAVGNQYVTISGFCKGSGMIHPNMATMLAVITTDIAAPPELLQAALQHAVDHSFNRISVDGDTSTNDTVLLLASGASGVNISTAKHAEDAKDGNQNFAPFAPSAVNNHANSAVNTIFLEELTDLCIDLAKQVVRDGEGATRLVEISVTGAADAQQAHAVANSIARSPLVKTAIHGGDPNWGRIVCAAGYSGAEIEPDQLTLAFGPRESELVVIRNGLPTAYAEHEAAALFRHDPVQIRLDLGLGTAQTTVWTCDFSKEYVEINAHYTT